MLGFGKNHGLNYNIIVKSMGTTDCRVKLNSNVFFGFESFGWLLAGRYHFNTQ